MKLFELQPQECRIPIILENKITTKSKIIKRVLAFNPIDVYSRINDADALNPFKRYNNIKFEILFPKLDGVCGCGCGNKLSGRRTRWFSNDCQRFATSVYQIITGDTSYLRRIRKTIIGKYICETCLNVEKDLELDHIIPVKHGGGGSWLSNYNFKCKSCHRIKTNTDFGFQSKK